MRKRTFRRLMAAEAAVVAILAGVLVDATVFAANLDKPKEPVSFRAPAAAVWAPEEPVEPEVWESLGEFRLTFYCPCYQCSEGWGHQTSSGAYATEGRTIAVDPRVIPYGTKVRIGDHVFVAEDRGGSIKGKRIDIFMESHAACRKAGVQYSEIFIKKEDIK